jgi:HEAT repeat protein
MGEKSRSTQRNRLLKRLTNENYVARLHAIRIIRQRRDRKLCAGVIQALNDRHYTVRSAAVETLAMIGTSDDALKLVPALKDKHYEVRYVAAEMLGLLKNKKSVPYLIEALNDREDIVRINAAESLGVLKATKAILPLIDHLKDRAELVRGYCAEALGEIGDKKAIPFLEKALSKEKRNSARLRIFEALYRLGDKSEFKPILGMLNTTSYRVRCAAANILVELVNRKNQGEILAALKARLDKEPIYAARSTILRAIGDIKMSLSRSGGK